MKKGEEIKGWCKGHRKELIAAGVVAIVVIAGVVYFMTVEGGVYVIVEVTAEGLVWS